jgi:predicted  nucleic acid-binding Zn-ribbon protein
VCAEYNVLLTSQLDSQRKHFESERRRHTHTHAKEMKALDEQMTADSAKVTACQEAVGALERDVAAKKIEFKQVLERGEKQAKTLSSLKTLNAAMQAKHSVSVAHVKKSTDALERAKRALVAKKSKELKQALDALNDLEVFLASQKKLAKGSRVEVDAQGNVNVFKEDEKLIKSGKGGLGAHTFVKQGRN